jgi:hypothetical protein
MVDRNYSESVPGLLIAVFGAVVAVYASQNYSIGTLQRMGPGMFPMALGVLIGGFGLAQALTGWFRSDLERIDLATIQWRAAFFILVSVIVFSLLIRTAGLIPAVFGVVGISAFADKGARPMTAIVLSVVLCAIAWLIFRVGLGMHFKLIDWPF